MKNNQTLLIAIDGPSSSGKGTIAKKIAKHFNLPCLNTGALYRAVAFLALENNLDLEGDIQKIIPLCDKILQSQIVATCSRDVDFDLESPKIHNEKIGKAASIVAANPEIRQNLFKLQRRFADLGIKNNGGAVLEGRDIGTTICPDANHKFFINADVEVRAQRRFFQSLKNDPNANLDLILEQLKNRDEQDKNRQSSPLKKDNDAIEIDTSNMNVEEVFKKILSDISGS
ncbi:MAG: cytidylate kinase [Rickettsiales bacterium]|jgi:cytidylate kinase